MYACLHVCMCVCGLVRYIYIYELFVLVYEDIYTCMYIHIRKYICVCTFLHACMHVCMQTHLKHPHDSMKLSYSYTWTPHTHAHLIHKDTSYTWTLHTHGHFIRVHTSCHTFKGSFCKELPKRIVWKAGRYSKEALDILKQHVCKANLLKQSVAYTQAEFL